MNNFENEVRKIFELPRIKSVERKILDLYRECEFRRSSYETNAVAISRLIEVRKELLDELFVFNDQSMRLLVDFNNSLKSHLTEVWHRTNDLAKKVIDDTTPLGSEVIGKCFLGWNYPKTHPVQTTRAMKIWDMLNGSIASFEPLYDDGVTFPSTITLEGDGIQSQSLLHFLYLDDKVDNWNDELDKEATKDMDLVFAFYNLWSHMNFSFFDLLWVRDFEIELSVNIESPNTAPDEYDDLDWSALDYY